MLLKSLDELADRQCNVCPVQDGGGILTQGQVRQELLACIQREPMRSITKKVLDLRTQGALCPWGPQHERMHVAQCGSRRLNPMHTQSTTRCGWEVRHKQADRHKSLEETSRRSSLK